jgi:hypothetical protein
MFDTKQAESLSARDLIVCRRVFDHVCTTQQITLEMHREDTAKRIILAYRSGLRDEDALIRLLTGPGRPHLN